MKNYIYTLIFFLLGCKIVYSQTLKHNVTVTGNLIKLYSDNYCKDDRIIGVHIYNDSTQLTTSKTWLALEALPKNYELSKKTKNYQWFKYKKAKIIIFCGFSESEKCYKFLNDIALKKINSTISLFDKNTNSNILDYKVKAWLIGINDNGKIDSVNGTFIESEIAKPKKYDKFLKKFSVLKLYQFYENSEIIDIKK